MVKMGFLTSLSIENFHHPYNLTPYSADRGAGDRTGPIPSLLVDRLIETGIFVGITHHHSFTLFENTPRDSRMIEDANFPLQTSNCNPTIELLRPWIVDKKGPSVRSCRLGHQSYQRL